MERSEEVVSEPEVGSEPGVEEEISSSDPVVVLLPRSSNSESPLEVVVDSPEMSSYQGLRQVILVISDLILGNSPQRIPFHPRHCLPHLWRLSSHPFPWLWACLPS